MSRYWRKISLALAVAAILAVACRGEEIGKAPQEGAAAGPAKEKIPPGDAGRRLYFEMRCREGHAGLCGELGLMWEKGYGGPKDGQKAREYYRLGCDQAVAASCAALGIELPPGKELEILGQKCDGGSAFACNNRGQMLLTGVEGTPADPGKALPVLEKGCAGGYASSCRSLAHVWRSGMGVTADEAKAGEYEARAGEADARIRGLEEKYLGMLPHDKLPIGRASQYTLDLAKAAEAQEEALRKPGKEAPPGASGAGASPGGQQPPKP